MWSSGGITRRRLRRARRGCPKSGREHQREGPREARPRPRLRRVPGQAAFYGGGNENRRVPRRRARKNGVRGGQRRELLSGSADGGAHGVARWPSRRHGFARPDRSPLSRRCHPLFSADRGQNRHPRFAARLRGLRDHGARIRVERLPRSRPRGKNDRGSRQRPRFCHGRLVALRREGYDVPRPVDVQVRGGGAPGRPRRHSGPRDRRRRLPVERSPERLDRTQPRSRREGQEHVAVRARGLDHGRGGAERIRARRCGLRRARRVRCEAGFQARSARRASRRFLRTADQVRRVEERDGRSARIRAARRSRGLHLALGPLRRSAPPSRATRSTTGPPTTRSPSRACSRRRRRSPGSSGGRHDP